MNIPMEKSRRRSEEVAGYVNFPIGQPAAPTRTSRTPAKPCMTASGAFTPAGEFFCKLGWTRDHMNINSKKPKPFCMEKTCPRKAHATVKMERTGAIIRLCKKHMEESFTPIPKPPLKN
jgi:hypothetical protein